MKREASPCTERPVDQLEAEVRAPQAAHELVEGPLADNPVLRMQQDIELAWTRSDAPRWPARRTLGFILLTNGLFWACLVLAIRAFS